MYRTFTVDEGTVVHEQKGRVYAFCCEACPQAFLEGPEGGYPDLKVRPD